MITKTVLMMEDTFWFFSQVYYRRLEGIGGETFTARAWNSDGKLSHMPTSRNFILVWQLLTTSIEIRWNTRNNFFLIVILLCLTFIYKLVSSHLCRFRFPYLHISVSLIILTLPCYCILPFLFNHDVTSHSLKPIIRNDFVSSRSNLKLWKILHIYYAADIRTFPNFIFLVLSATSM